METVLNKTEKPNSFNFRYGKSGTDVKVYFDTAEDLNSQIERIANFSEQISGNLDRIKKNLENGKE